MFTWKKLGKIFDPADFETESWMQEYAQLPFPLEIDNDRLRVYFATRPNKDGNKQYISRSGYVDLSKNDFKKVIQISKNPILELGGLGTFDEFGSMTSSFVAVNNKIYAYYTGWTRMQSVPYTMSIGMAISSDGGETFNKVGEGPILGITTEEPYLLSGPIVKIIHNEWHMWYLKGVKWILVNNIAEPIYRIAHATSENGIHWKRDGRLILPTKFEDECQVSFAVFFKEKKWHVIFAYRSPRNFRENSNCAYRLGYAWSTDLLNWNREDEKLGLDVSEEGWDSQMQSYPQVCEMDGRIILFYCGNQFGLNGFGAAELIML